MSRHDRIPAFDIQIVDTAERYPCPAEESLLHAMERLGRRGIPAGCRGGGCGVCKVEILAGEVVSARMSRAHVDDAERAAGRVLACRSYPRSNVSLRVVGAMRKGFTRHGPR
ncbi:hypothetical protein KBTX_03435 [wastewater metagenome]|uniref:2Fe-2S ferredoxin-type domain-containing protein n=2 Tax=unclassified sequences TaxID=12908 RepID=A0A5B8RE07_9ZZZZ|nr:MULTISPECIES: 2Fe-2S iron-sulfur cluster binding domain-containing protein [Arhodomonas]QEA07090.1 hypothetical protein KBTEX_03435 [uncultured organism]